MPPPPPPPTGEGEGERKPKRKPQPKPKGSDLECEVLPADDLATFCATWIKKASDAQGISASICAQLEEFESQEKLAGLIRDSADGLSQHRKEMIGLGPNLRLDQVNSVLEKAKLYHIGKGAAASLLQKFAKAAVLESGEDHVSASTRWAARLGNHGKRTYHTEDTFHKALSRSDDAIIKCPISYVVIPVVDKQAARALRRKPNKKRRFNVRNAKNTKGKKHQPTKSGAAPQPITQKKWPVMNPRVMLDAVAKAGANHLLEGDDFDWLEFWEAAKSEPWGRSHVVQSWPAEKRKRAIGIAAHGDEGQGKKDKSVLVLSWSSFGVHKRSTSCKFPFAVMRSTCFAYDGKRNLTLEMLQKHYVRMFNECAHMPDGDQLSLHYCAGKGDWKFKKEWLDEPRSYLRAAKKEDHKIPPCTIEEWSWHF
eukprot:g30100.t1